MDEREVKTIQELEEEIEYLKKSAAADSTHKSETLREMFEFSREKLPQRTRLNEKEIQAFALVMANMQILDPAETRLWPTLYLDILMELKISLKGLGRGEGMSIFQLQAEEKEAQQQGFTP